MKAIELIREADKILSKLKSQYGWRAMTINDEGWLVTNLNIQSEICVHQSEICVHKFNNNNDYANVPQVYYNLDLEITSSKHTTEQEIEEITEELNKKLNDEIE